ncbi:hypothetical protein CDD83_4077 [Cordyceps sp. RAO-2017]|nr:hypothetical protein CDD83_4077 [Cordyceps sp. RAO-2017]
MKRVSLGVAAAMLQSSLVGGTKVTVREIGEHAVITDNRVTWNNGGFVDGFECAPPNVLSLSADKKVGGCCQDGNTLRGPAGPDKEYHCCANGHDLAGNKDVGFNCCPTGQDFDGKLCRLVCSNGKALVGGKSPSRRLTCARLA